MQELDGPRWGPASKGKAQQLVVLCHGVGADGHDLIDLAPGWGHALPDAAFVAPSAPEPYDMAPDLDGQQDGPRQWFSLQDRTPARLLAGAQAAAPLLDAFIAAELHRLDLPAEQVALVGFSQGAMMVLHAGLRRTPAPRAILAYSGAMLSAQNLANHAPVLLVHGEADEVVPVARSYQAERDLRGAGVPVEAVWCPGLGHGIEDAGISAGALFLQRAFAGGAATGS